MMKFYQVCVSFFIFASLMMSPALCFAAGEGPDHRGSFILDDMIVTATKKPEKRKDIPNAVIILDEATLGESGAKTIGERLANESGIFWRTYGNYAGAAQEIHIRGMKGNATQVFLNGANINSLSLGLTDVGKIPMNNIERIEIVKGAGSLLYGSGAGTINIITKGPKKDKMDLSISAGFGSQNTYQISAENGMFLTKNFGYYAAANRTETDGFRSNSNLRQSDASLKLVFNRPNFDASLSGSYLDRSYGMPGVKPPAGTQDYYVGGLRFYDNESSALLDTGSDKDQQISAEVKGQPSQWFGYDLTGYFTKMKNRTYRRYAYNGSGNDYLTVNEVLGATGHIDLYPFSVAKLLLGAEYKDLGWQVDSNLLDSNGLPDSYRSDEAHLFTKGFFAEAEYRPSKYVKALAGIRHEKHATFGSENIPVFGLVINPTEKTVLKFNHGKHFMAPTFNDLYYPADLLYKGNENLKAESGWNSDVTIEQSFFHDKIFLALSAFRWNIDDKIQWEPDSQGVYSPVNLAGYEAKGAEAEVKIGPFYDVTLALTYTYTDAEEESRAYTRMDYGWPPFLPPDFQYTMAKSRASYTPEHQFKGLLTYKNASGLTIAATAIYVGDMVRHRPETTAYPDVQMVADRLDDYWAADIKIEQRLFKNWLISLTGKNIFDKGYDTYLESFTDPLTYKSTMCGYPGAGRSLFGAVTYKF
ncbi:MAG: TonB-dependent receptor [Deltaproteobacteria bacterium]|nr:TonB-dependent receptor [Deltaproteobacteria bacterium]